MMISMQVIYPLKCKCSEAIEYSVDCESAHINRIQCVYRTMKRKCVGDRANDLKCRKKQSNIYWKQMQPQGKYNAKES